MSPFFIFQRIKIVIIIEKRQWGMKMLKGYVWLYEIHNTKTDKKKLFIVNAKDSYSALVLIANYEFEDEAYAKCNWLRRQCMRLGRFSSIGIEVAEIVYVTEVKKLQRVGGSKKTYLSANQNRKPIENKEQ
jgi:hypothetical protein